MLIFNTSVHVKSRKIYDVELVKTITFESQLFADNALLDVVCMPSRIISGVARGRGVGGSTPSPHSHRSRFFHSSKVTVISIITSL